MSVIAPSRRWGLFGAVLLLSVVLPPAGITESGTAAGPLQPVWTRLLGGPDQDHAFGVALAPDGSAVYTVGETTNTTLDGQVNAGQNELVLASYRPDGQRNWVRLLGGPDNEFGLGIVTAADGAIYVTGYSASPKLRGRTNAGDLDLLLAKFLPNGDLVWVRLLGGAGQEVGRDITIGPDGMVYVVGSSDSPTVAGQSSAGGFDILVARYSPRGKLRGARLLGGPGDDFGRGITAWRGGTVYLTGLTTIPSFGSSSPGIAAGSQMVVARLQRTLAHVWTRFLGATSGGVDIAAAPGRRVYVAGHTDSAIGGQQGHGDFDIILARYNPSGALRRTRLIGGSASDLATGISIGPDGSLYVSADTQSTSFSSAGGGPPGAMLLLKLGAAGDIRRARRLAGANWSFTTGVVAAPDGSVYLSGHTESAIFQGQTSAGGLEAVLIKLQ